MPTANAHVFPLVPYPGLAPELALRSGMGGWAPYALTVPSDRLLPFTYARLQLPGNSPWVNCARIEHADTGEVLMVLAPTGSQPASVPVPTGGLVLAKLPDTANHTDYFTYNGAIIPDLGLPCGVPLRLVLENTLQSPRFYALAPAAALDHSHLQLEWFHDAPQPGVPYGRGLRQRFYLDNGALQRLDPREVEQVSKDPDTGAETTGFLAQFAQQSFTVDPVPPYLADAFAAARSVRAFLADGEPWRVLTVKSTPSATGGRASLAVTLESLTPRLLQGCRADPLPVVAYDAVADAVRAYRCGDSSDTAPDYLATGDFACELASAKNTGYVLETVRDTNPYSASYGQTKQQKSAAPDPSRCPVPTTYYSIEREATATRSNCPSGQLGGDATYVVPAGAYTSLLSQDDANKQAQDAANSGAQAYANANGTCQVGRRVSVANVQPKTKLVQFDLSRTDSSGLASVTVVAQAVVLDADGVGSAQQFTQTFVLPDGTSSLTGVTIGYGGAVLDTFQTLTINAVSPSDYFF